MTKPFKINLKTALTDEAIAAAAPNMGACSYSAPCIIGAMLTPKQLKVITDYNDGETVGNLFDAGIITFEDGIQLSLACKLQYTFDRSLVEDFNIVVDQIRSL